MSGFTITNIEGNLKTPNKNNNFIVIHGVDIYMLLTKISKENKTSILRIDIEKIKETMKEYKLMLDDYVILGDIYYSNNIEPKRIILANKNICIVPNKINVISTYSNGLIVEPFHNDNSNYLSLGLFYIDKGKTLNVNNIGIVNKKLISSNNKNNMDILTSNDYNLLSNTKIGIRNIMFSYFEMQSNNKWNKYKGQHFVLSESDDPWYKKIIKPDVRINIPIIQNNKPEKIKNYYNELCIILLFILIVIILLNTK